MKIGYILLIILIIIIAAMVILYFVGRRLEKRQAAQMEQIEAAKQNVTMLVIDKKRLPIRESGLPDMVIEQTPKYLRRSKMPIVKAKIGPRVMNMVADEKIFDIIPVKKEVRATISGIYITDVKALRGTLEAPPAKKSAFRRFRDWAFAQREKEKALEAKSSGKTVPKQAGGSSSSGKKKKRRRK
ncbi:MAG: hypothetical protein K6E30_11310 [Lachnospiraceae bacterium]|nr:hypothetical protein [Lachnospiraceae bacterium]